MRRPLTASAVFTALLLVANGVGAQDFDFAGEQQMLGHINAMRSAQGLSPLSRDDGLDEAARVHSNEMAATGELTHVSETTGTPADRVRAAGVSASLIAENVALHRSASDAHEALVASDAHRANMLNPNVTHVGLAALRTERGVYVTQLFAALAAEEAELEAPSPPVEAPELIEPEEIEPELIEPEVIESAPEEQSLFEPPADSSVAPPEAECITPVPGVRLCGRLPAMSAPSARPVAPAPAPSAPAPTVEERAPVAPPPNLHVQPGTNGTVVIQRSPDNSRVEGYWVYSGRWWFYPMPPSVQPGQRLHPDLRVSGPPPGFPEHPFGAPPAARPQAYRIAPPAPIAVPVQPPPPSEIRIAPGTVFYTVPPPPMVGAPDRAWRRAHRQWTRAYRRWLREQARIQRQAL